MKIKRVVKRLCAVGAGLTMLGATAMGALAADLSDYPNMFVTDGVYDGFFVVGENAASVDNLAMTDIATSMKVGSGSSTTTSVEGDNWLVGTSSKKLEMANNNASDSSVRGEDFRAISTFIGSDELGALTDGSWDTNENDYGFNQFMFFDIDGTNHDYSRIVKYTENGDNDVTADHLFFATSRQIARYKAEFTSTAQSDVTDSSGTSDTTGTYLDDFDNTDLNLLGKDMTVVLARRTSSGGTAYQNGIKLTLMAGAARDTLLEGATQAYQVGEKNYEVTLTFTDSDEAQFIVNGETTNKLKVGETQVLADKSEIGVSEILYQAYAGGVHQATFFVGAQKIVLQDDDVTDATGSYNVKVGSEDIDGTTVIVSGTDDNTTFTVSTIEVNMTAEDDYFVANGEMLSDVIASTGEENEVLFTNNWDVLYAGLSEEATHDIRLKKSASRRYDFTLFDGDGMPVDIPLAYAESASNLSLGKETQLDGSARAGQKRLVLNVSEYIYKDDYFVLTGGTAGDGSAKSYLLQYKGQDRTSKTSPKIKFKNVGSGETLEYSASTSNATATIKLGGYSFLVHGQSSSTDDQPVLVERTGSGGAPPSPVAPVGTVPNFVDSYGSQWTFKIPDSAQGLSSRTLQNFTVAMTTPNGNDYDNQLPAQIVLSITPAAGPEVRAAISNVTLLTPDGETEVSYGYTSMGAKIKFDEPASDPDELTLTYPMEQRLPQVYFTSGATSTTTVKSGDLVAVQVVDAARLDSEIAAVNAQNLIVVGGPCVNTIAADLLGNPADCTEGFTPGNARVKLFEHTNGNMAMLVAGYSGADTRLAGKVIASGRALFGDEVVIEGTTTADATVSAPVEEVTE